MSSKIEELRKLRNNIELVVNGDPTVLHEAPTIVITNHNCLKDIFYLPMSLSKETQIISLISSRLIYKNEKERQNLVNKYLYSMPIEAHGGKSYVNLCLNSAAKLLYEGNNLNVFPEGAYIDDKEHVYKGRTGAIRILFSAKEKGSHPNIVPIALAVDSVDNNLDSYDLSTHDKVVVNILKPINYNDAYYNYKNSANLQEKNINLHKVIDTGMMAIANSLDREYIDSYIELYPKGNVIFADGKKIDTNIAQNQSYILQYKNDIEKRSKSLKKVLNKI